MPPKWKPLVAVGLALAALIVLGLAQVLGWDLGAYVDGTLKGLIGGLAGYLIPSPGDQTAVLKAIGAKAAEVQRGE